MLVILVVLQVPAFSLASGARREEERTCANEGIADQAGTAVADGVLERDSECRAMLICAVASSELASSASENAALCAILGGASSLVVVTVKRRTHHR